MQTFDEYWNELEIQTRPGNMDRRELAEHAYEAGVLAAERDATQEIQSLKDDLEFRRELYKVQTTQMEELRREIQLLKSLDYFSRNIAALVDEYDQKTKAHESYLSENLMGRKMEDTLTEHAHYITMQDEAERLLVKLLNTAREIHSLINKK